MYDTILNKYGGELLFESNLQTQDIKRICKDNEFQKNIIQGWNTCQNCFENNFSKHIIWNNGKKKNENKTLYWKDWHDKGIVFVDQLIDFRVKKFYSFTDFKYIYNSSDNDFLKYNSLINNIPKDIVELVDERFLTG